MSEKIKCCLLMITIPAGLSYFFYAIYCLFSCESIPIFVKVSLIALIIKNIG